VNNVAKLRRQRGGRAVTWTLTWIGTGDREMFPGATPMLRVILPNLIEDLNNIFMPIHP
jgi:hypothetical protein